MGSGVEPANEDRGPGMTLVENPEGRREAESGSTPIDLNPVELDDGL